MAKDNDDVASRVVAKNELADLEPKMEIGTIITMVSRLNDEFDARKWEDCATLTHRLLNKLQAITLTDQAMKRLENKNRAA